MRKIYFLQLFIFLSIANLSAQFAASNFTMLSNISPEPGSGIKYSGCWGWTDTLNDKEYGIAGSTTGTYFVDITNPATPSVCAFYPAVNGNGNWREMKSYKNYLYVVNDNGSGTLGLQIFDMSTLPTTVTLVSQNMNLFRRGHAAWIDGDKLYVSGVTYSNNVTSSLDVYSLATPTAPVLLRRLNQDYPSITYVHDSFVRHDTVYASAAYQGLYVYKFTAANTFTQLGSLTTYPGSGYNHASAITPNGQHLVMLDEVPASLPIKVLDVTNLSNIVVTSTANQFPQSTPHNPFMLTDQYCLVSAYQDGTQLWDISNPNAPFLAGYFDTYPTSGGNNNTWPGGANYNGQWGLYPWFPSKSVFALDRHNGIFVLNTHLYANPEINVASNAINIPDGSVATGTANNTEFGSVIIPATVSHTFVVENSGLGPLSVTSMSINGASASDFTITSPAGPFTVAPSGGSQTMSIQFAPSSAGTKTAMIHLASNDINEAGYDFVVSGFAISTVDLRKQASENFDLVVYPNPAFNHITVKYNDMKAEDATLKLINSLGQVVMEESLSNDCCVKELNVEGLPKGIYLLQVKGKTLSEVRTVMIN